MTPHAEHRRFFGAGLALDAAKHCLHNAKTVRIATAFFEPGGWELLQSALFGKDVRVLVGRSEGARDKLEDLLEEFFAEIESGALADRAATLKHILAALRQNKLSVRLARSRKRTLLDARYTYHHAKLYISDETSTLVTSANFTRSGLIASREAGYLATEPSDVAYFVERFDTFFAESESLTEPLIEALEELLELRSPEEIYARTLLEIYGARDEKAHGELQKPARYQEPIITRITRSLLDTHGAFLIASTGLGKTVIAAHAVARLREAGAIHYAMIFAPAGLRDMWQLAMRNARISSREYSYTILSHDDWQKYRQVFLLENELRGDLQSLLIILDESHHMRNAEDGVRELRLRNHRIERAVASGAYVLLLTATPYSRSVDDINWQLRLLPKTTHSKGLFASERHLAIESPAELSELPPCTVLTAPTVVRHFSQVDEHGERFIVFGDNKRMYFPSRIHLRTVEYANSTNGIYWHLLHNGLLRRRTKDTNERLFDEDELAGKRDALFEARLIHQFCSSHAQVKEALEKLSCEGGYDKLRFEKQGELTLTTKKFLREVESLPENKFSKLCDILRHYTKEKVVIFCIYRHTALELVQKLKAAFPKIKIATTVNENPDELENILDFFAPIANGKLNPDKNDTEFAQKLATNCIDWLVASEAIAEGFNLQDARILINYDLPWSVLQLAQRMGRLMRPWHEVRELFIYNFVPDTMSDTRLQHALRWRSRLDERSRAHASFANLPVILPQRGKSEEAMNLFDLGEALRSFDEADLELNDAMDFIAQATQIHTSTVLDDLAKFTPEFREKIMRLRHGFRSRVETQKEIDAAIFLLIRRRGAAFPAVFNLRAELIFSPQDLTRPLELLRSYKNAPIFGENFDFVAMDNLTEQCLQTWCSEFHADRQEIRLICALHFA